MAERADSPDAEMDGDSSEEDPETMTERQKDLLTKHHDTLANRMDPRKVVWHLQRRGVLDQFDREKILAPATTLDKNDRLIETISKRSRADFYKFIDVLWVVDTALAEEIIPTRFRVLWYVASTSDAAAVVYVLEKYANIVFCDVEVGADCLFRCGRAFDVDEMSCLEVRLVFPVDETPDSMSKTMTAAFVSVCPQADMALMSGVCRGGGDGVTRSGDLVVANQVTQLSGLHPPVGPRRVHLEKLEHHLQNLIQPPWLEEVNSDLLDECSKQNQTLWLTQLYLELLKCKNGQQSDWLTSCGWSVSQSLRCKENQAVLARNLPDWESGKLASFLLRGRALFWQSDHKSPLGMSPPDSLLATAKKKTVPVAINSQVPLLAAPHFGTIAAEQGASRESDRQVSPLPLAYDSGCFQFYTLCSSKLGAGKPWFVCKGISYELGGSQRLGVISSTCLLMEAMKVFAELQKNG